MTSSICSPSISADRSMETKSPSWTARSTPLSVPKRARRSVRRCSTASSSTFASSTVRLDVAEVGQVDLGALVDLGGEDEVLAVGRGHLQVGDLGLAERADLVLLEGLAVERREGVVDGLLEDGRAADALLDDAGRHLALAEAGHLDVLTDVLDGRVEARLEPPRTGPRRSS